jgi:hypothetical protein
VAPKIEMLVESPFDEAPLEPFTFLCGAGKRFSSA